MCLFVSDAGSMVVINLPAFSSLSTGLYFSGKTPEELSEILYRKIIQARIPRMVITMGDQGAVYAEADGIRGVCPPQRVDVIDTTGAGDAFFSGVTIGLTYGKSIAEACAIGTRLAASVIMTDENCCPRFQPAEFDIHF